MKRRKTVRSLTQEEKEELKSLAGSRSAPHRLVQRATIILAMAEGCSQAETARRAGLSPSLVDAWVYRGVGVDIRRRLHHRIISN